MKLLILSAALLCIALATTAQVSCNPDVSTKKARKQLLDNSFLNASPLIVFEFDTLSKKDFLRLKDKDVRAVVLPPDTASLLYGHYGEKGAIQLWRLHTSENDTSERSVSTTLADDTLKSRLLKIAILTLGFPNSDPQLNIDNKTVTRHQFLAFDGIIQSFAFFKPGDPFLGDSTIFDLSKRGRVDVTSVEGDIKASQVFRKTDVFGYRYNELDNFFGFNRPLVLLNGNEITVREFVRLGEDSVAFIGYYTTDFVKSRYGEKGKNGVVIVKTSDNIIDITDVNNLPMPLEPRNYITTHPHQMPLGFDLTGFSEEWLSKNAPSELKGIKTEVYVSTMVLSDGTIKPIIVTDIKDYESMDTNIQDYIVETSMILVNSMPKADLIEPRTTHLLLRLKYDITN